ncbi:hypothetical protein PAJ53_09195 [Campylobacter jejuni]|nr:hypothetical protein [Campylobacter jejuni]
MKKIISVLILALSLLNAKSFGESKKELVMLYDSLGSAYQYDFIVMLHLKQIKKENTLSLK